MKKKLLVSLFLAVLLAGLILGAAAAADLVLAIDIKPCKDPNVVNVNQPGWLPVAILEQYTQVDPTTVALQGVPTTEWFIKSGYLLVKFDAAAVIDTLGAVKNGEVIELTLTGKLFDGTSFSGYDEIVILKRGR